MADKKITVREHVRTVSKKGAKNKGTIGSTPVAAEALNRGINKRGTRTGVTVVGGGMADKSGLQEPKGVDIVSRTR